MADKIQITSDGTVKGTKIKMNGTEMTSEYTVTDIYFSARASYKYQSQESCYSYSLSPRVNYSVTYHDSSTNSMKSISIGTMPEEVSHGAIGKNQDFVNSVGSEYKDSLKSELLDEFDILRKDHKNLPDRKTLGKRTIESLIDKYNDIKEEIK